MAVADFQAEETGREQIVKQQQSPKREQRPEDALLAREKEQRREDEPEENVREGVHRRFGSGERTRPACWQRRPRRCGLGIELSLRMRFREPEKFVSARRRNQHAGRVRSPDVSDRALMRK